MDELRSTLFWCREIPDHRNTAELAATSTPFPNAPERTAQIRNVEFNGIQIVSGFSNCLSHAVPVLLRINPDKSVPDTLIAFWDSYELVFIVLQEVEPVQLLLPAEAIDVERPRFPALNRGT